MLTTYLYVRETGLLTTYHSQDVAEKKFMADQKTFPGRLAQGVTKSFVYPFRCVSWDLLPADRYNGLIVENWRRNH